MQDDLNIIRKFCAVGWCEDVRVVAAWLRIPDERALAIQRVLQEGTDELVGSRRTVDNGEDLCVMVPAASSVSILRHRNPYR